MILVFGQDQNEDGNSQTKTQKKLSQGMTLSQLSRLSDHCFSLDSFTMQIAALAISYTSDDFPDIIMWI